jgi:hypothetical protein
MSHSERLKLENRYAELWVEIELPKLLRKFQREHPASLSEASQQASPLKSLHPLSSTTVSLKPLSNKRKTDDSKENNQSETPKAKPITVPCQTRHPKHLRRHKNPITQVYLKLETILISWKYHLSKQTQRQLTQIYLNGDDNHE